MKHNLTQEYLKEALTYNQYTGEWTWKERPERHFASFRAFKIWNKRYSLKKTYNINRKGYIDIVLNNRKYRAHRLAFLYVDGYIPENQVDHIDGNRKNNKYDNLREVNNKCNHQNCKLSKLSKSGITGVHYYPERKKWLARIMIDGKTINLGAYDTKDDAAIARYLEERDNPKWSCSVCSSSYKYLKNKGISVPAPTKKEKEID